MNAPQNNEIRQLLSQLADISGLDRIGWWPLAPGWWVIIALFILALASAVFRGIRRWAYRKSWRYDTDKALLFLMAELDAENARESLIKLSGMLRRIAIRRFSRAECAGLHGIRWAEWLTRNDPHKFNWNEYAALLTETSYAPPQSAPSPEKVKLLIGATRKWIR
jgi:hypothetical protein